MPTARNELTSSVINNVIYAIGGCDGGPKNTLEAYFPSNNSWIKLPPIPNPRWVSTSSTINNAFYVFGGTNDGVTDLNLTESYNPTLITTNPTSPKTVNPSSTFTTTGDSTSLPSSSSKISPTLNNIKPKTSSSNSNITIIIAVVVSVLVICVIVGLIVLIVILKLRQNETKKKMFMEILKRKLIMQQLIQVR